MIIYFDPKFFLIKALSLVVFTITSQFSKSNIDQNAKLRKLSINLWGGIFFYIMRKCILWKVSRKFKLQQAHNYKHSNINNLLISTKIANFQWKKKFDAKGHKISTTFHYLVSSHLLMCNYDKQQANEKRL